MQKKYEDIDFEISFCENLLKKIPGYTQALVVLGEAYTKRGMYEKGLEIDKRLIELKPNDPIAFYNLACSYSLLGLIYQGLEALRKSIRCGYRDFKWMKKDPDLDNLRKSAEYEAIVKQLSESKQEL